MGTPTGRRMRAALGALLVFGVLGADTAAGQALRLGQPAPDVAGAPWINCRNVIPQLRAWHEKYAPAGLAIIGVHSPEFFWEKSYEKVVDVTRRLGVRYPVVQDNDFAIWNRWGVRAWPTSLLVDKQGVVRCRHIGEGDYAETEAMIRRLLAEAG